MGVPVAHKAECWIAEFAMTESGGQWCGLGARPINGRQGGAVERHGDGRDGPSLSSPEGAPTPPASRLASWWRFSSPGDLRCSTTRSFGYENGEDSECQQYFSPRSELSQENSDTDSMSTSISRIHSFRSGASSPMDSPVKRLEQRNASPPTRRSSLFSQYSPSYPPNSGGGSEDVDYSFEDPPSHDDEHNQDPPQPIDFESNGLIWYPPPPEDEGDDLENGFFEYDDDDEDDGGDSGEFFRHGNCDGDGDGDGDDDILGIKGKHNIAHKEFLRNALHGHFKVLVSQLLQGHGVDPADGWLDIVSSLAWQAANFVRPDTSGGGSMDPTNYVKVKCMASGNPNDSTFIRGVVCSKNVKHKRMISQHRNPRLLLLGGALEHQKVTNRLASINSILEQEKEYLKNAVAKIEAQRPHVLLVEKSVPLFAQQLLAKQISLVLNVKKPLLERISHCTGAEIASSIENLASARLGQCQTFRVERITECSSPNNSSKKSVKTLMFFEGCPRRLGCTVLLRGANYEELKKVKLAVQFAVFAAYHLSLETSFLADEGATLPKIPLGLSAPPLEKPIDGGNCPSSYCLEKFSEVQSICDKHTGNRSCSTSAECHDSSLRLLSADEALLGSNPKQKEYNAAVNDVFPCSPTSSLNNGHVPLPDINVQPSASLPGCLKQRRSKDYIRNIQGDEMVNGMFRAESNLDNDWHHISDEEHKGVVVYNHNEHYNEYPQSILVSLSIGCPLSGIVCKQSQLFRIKFYSNVDKPLGRYFHEDLFNQTSCCESCKEPAEAHVRCYTHQQGSLAISVRNLPSVNLPGERDGKIWMWHRCLRCKLKDGIPPATQRVVMSDAARGLSFGKFLELSFSNHTTANRIACCGHSLQRDCLRFYGFGSMVAVFRHSPVDILSVKLPPSILDFSYPIPQEWITKEATAVSNMKECFYREIFDELNCIEKIVATQDGSMKAGMYKHIVDLKDLIKVEQKKYSELFGFASIENLQTLVSCIDILELNRLRQELVLDAYIWERRLYMMQSLAEDNCHNATIGAQCSKKLPGSLLDESKTELSHSHENMGSSLEQIQSSSLTTVANSGKPLLMREQNDTSPILLECNTNTIGGMPLQPVEGYVGSAGLPFISGQCETQSEGLLGDGPKLEKALERTQSSASCLSNRIDLAWTCSNQFVNDPTKCGMEALVGRPAATMDFPSFQKAIAPIRIKSFDSAISFRNRLSSIDDAKANIRRAYSQRSPRALERIGRGLSSTFRSRLLLSGMMDSGGRLLLPQNASDVVVAVYDDEPSSMIAHAMTTDEYYDLLFPPVDQHNELDRFGVRNSVDLESTSRSFSCGSLQSSGSDQPQPLSGNISKYVHFTVSFEDEHSCSMDKAKFSVTCYFAKQFDAIRRKCCPNELDYIRSLSRCKRWSAQGGKSNAYFAKTLDDRFVIKQVTRTELDSFEDFAPEYFKYLTESLSGSPTCLAKILGLYQVVAKNLRGGKELKMDVMVMENLFFKRKISRIYDLKGSLRSRYNPDSSGNNKVLLDLNLLETLHTKPIFLGHKAKRRLERAVWNDTSFLASVDVMDYSLLVGIDEERKELVMGIIDYLRQYTWDKQLETWVKTSGILGGPKNTLPTIISPVQYKKRFRKAMSKYFLTVPDQWSS